MAMMLHRHFEKQKEKRGNLTTLNDVTPQGDDEPFETAREDDQPRRGRKRKETEE